jgi:Leucine-rich repeat (LRR) protein
MPALEDLTVIGLADPDVAPLAGKTTLRSLELRARRARSLTPLAGLSGLRSLKLANGIVSDIGPVGHLTGLEVLHLSAPRARSLEPLAGLHQLRELRIEAPLPDSGQGWLPRAAPLRSLYLKEPGTLEPIRGFDGLEMLILSFSRPLDLRPLESMGALRTLNLLAEGDWPEALTVPPLEGVEKITLRGAAFTSLDGMQAATALRELFLHGTGVTTLDPLAGLAHLDRIEVTDSPLNDVSALAFLPRFLQQGQAKLLLRGTDLAARHPELARFESMHPRDAHEFSGDTAWRVTQYARALVRAHRA